MNLKSSVKSLSFISTLAMLSGCTTLTSNTHESASVEKSNVYWFDHAAKRPGGYLVPRVSVHDSKNGANVNPNKYIIITR